MLRLAGCIAALPLLACLSDPSCFQPQAAFEEAQKTFKVGYLALAARQSDVGYRRSSDLGGDWARRFRILEASVMVWDGDDEQVLRLLSEKTATPAPSSENEVAEGALRATALTHLGQFQKAEKVLGPVEGTCARAPLVQCEAVLRSRALLSLYRGHTVEARRSYFRALDLARQQHDRFTEGVVLSNLGTTFSLAEEHDEALSYEEQAHQIAMELGAQDLAQRALGNEGDVFHSLGNADKALELYLLSLKQAVELGDRDGEAWALTVAAQVYADTGQLKPAENFDLRAIKLAKQINRTDKIINASEDLAQVYIYEGKTGEAEHYAGEAEALAQESESRPDVLLCHLLAGEAAAQRHDWNRADALLHEVVAAPESQKRMRWSAQHTLATIYEAQGNAAVAEQSYKAAIGLVEGARSNLHQEVSRLTFLNNAADIYNDYIDFLVSHGRADEALEAADWSRARTLQQGLGAIPANALLKPPALNAREIARKTGATLLFYWLGGKQSYVWAISPEKTDLVTLPAREEILARMDRYRQTLLKLKDPLRENNRQGNRDGRDLYDMLVAPIAGELSQERQVILFTDGEMSRLNFETLLVGGPTPHYWIEDATISSAPSIRMLAGKTTGRSTAHEKLLLLGDPIASDPELPRLPMAELEVAKVQAKFSPADEVVLSGSKATPLGYLASKPELFAYIHFVAHGTTSKTDPLESAVILSSDSSAKDSYKLFARDILKHSISAQLVVISACNSSGSKSYAGEGVVGLSWAFLRAGAHNTIGTLWDVSDASTPQLMDLLYLKLQGNEAPASALRDAKLSLLHSNGNFSRPFYWAPFQLYAGR